MERGKVRRNLATWRAEPLVTQKQHHISLSMKKCTYCGKEYPEDATACAIDGQALESDAPKPPTSLPSQNDQHVAVVKRLTRIAPLQAGIVLGVFYGVLSVIAVPFLALTAMSAIKANTPIAAVGVLIVIGLPLIYAVCGFIGGVIAAFLYNLIAKFTGGLEFETRESPRIRPPS